MASKYFLENFARPYMAGRADTRDLDFPFVNAEQRCARVAAANGLRTRTAVDRLRRVVYDKLYLWAQGVHYVDVEGYTDSSQVVQAPLIPKTEAPEESKERYCSAPRYLVFYELDPETLEYARGLAASWGYSAIKYAEVPGRLYIEPVYGQAVRAAAGK